MKLNFKTWTDFHHQLFRIYHAIIAVSLVPFILVFLEIEGLEVSDSRVSPTVTYMLLIVLLPLSAYLCWRVWRGDSSDAETNDHLNMREKLLLFRKKEINKYLLLEYVCVLALVGLWLTGHYLFVIGYFVAIAQFSFLRPTEDRFVRSMNVSKAERNELRTAVFES